MKLQKQGPPTKYLLCYKKTKKSSLRSNTHNLRQRRDPITYAFAVRKQLFTSLSLKKKKRSIDKLESYTNAQTLENPKNHELSLRILNFI